MFSFQESLADKITEIIHCLKKHKSANKFFKASFEVIPKYWSGLPHCMLNKMMMVSCVKIIANIFFTASDIPWQVLCNFISFQLFRRSYRQALLRLADHKWEYIESFVSVMEETIIRPLDDAHECDYRIKTFLMDIYLEELAKASDENLDHSKILIFLQPYIKVRIMGILLIHMC